MTETKTETLETPNRFLFIADGTEFLLLLLKNLLFTILSLGVYWFWARVEVTKFLYRATQFQGFRFDFHATGKERLIGFLKAFGILLLAGGINYLFVYLLSKVVSEETSQVLGTLILYVVIFSALPFILVAALRFRLSRTSFNGIRFQFLGNEKEFTILFLKNIGITFISCGLYYPWAIAAISNYIAQNSLYGNHAFDLRVKGDPLFVIYLKGFFLSMFTFGIYSFWFQAELHNYFWNNYYFQNGKTNSDLTGGKLFLTFIKSVVFILFSLGIAIPWVIIMNKKVLVESVSFSTLVDFDIILNIPLKPGSATIENIGGDALDSFGSIVG